MKKAFLLYMLLAFFHIGWTQSTKDSTITIDGHVVTLSEVVIDTRLNVASFIKRVQEDTSFYKAFKNLRVLGFSAINDIKMLNSKGNVQASLHSKTKQLVEHGCRRMETQESNQTGDLYKNDRWNYYTPQLYASLFFTKDTICGETNIVGHSSFSTQGKSGIDKHKEQLKMLFFNPGKKINGIPFLSNKTELFDPSVSQHYDMTIDIDEYKQTSCYVFKQVVKPGHENNVAIDAMTTWFNDSTFEVVARNYSLSYDAGVYDFNVRMEVEMTRFKDLLVPSLIRYNGNWKAIFKKRERGVFTATLFDFEN